MKTVLSILLLFYFQSKATNYYVSSAGNDSNPGTIASPFKTLGKVNSLSLLAGDRVFFNGEFIGTLNTKQGVTYSSYNGMATITGFRSFSGSGLFTTSVKTSVVTVDGVYYPMGKTDYFKVSSHVGTSSITSATTIPNCPGAEIVWRPYHWVLWRGLINSQTSTTVNFTPFPSTSGGNPMQPQNGYGFFIQNHPSLCTSFGSWACNSGALTVRLDNSAHTIKAASVDVLINLVSNVTLKNLIIRGANTYAVNMNSASGFIIDSCDISYSGIGGVFGNGTSPSGRITNCNFTYNASFAIRCDKADKWNVSNNNFYKNCFYAGMGGSGTGQYIVVRDIKNGAVFQYNRIINSGYIPITFQGTSNNISFNFIDSFCTVIDDGSGIYCGGQDYTGTKVFNNIVLHGIGARAGTPDPDQRAHGIYVDDGGHNLEIYGNTLAFNGNGGINLHNAHEINIHDNTSFDNAVGQIVYYNDGDTIMNISLNKNIFFSNSSSELVHRSSGGTRSAKTFFVSADNNFWCRPLNENSNFQTYVPSGTYNLGSWKTFTGKEVNSKITPVSVTSSGDVRFEYNGTASIKNIILDATYVDVNKTPYTAVTLQPYTSIILIKTGIIQTYFNAAISKQFVKNDCTNGTGSTVTYTVSAGKYSSTISQADADLKATSDIAANGQTYANTNGTCIVKTIIKIMIYYSDGSVIIQQ